MSSRPSPAPSVEPRREIRFGGRAAAIASLALALTVVAACLFFMSRPASDTAAWIFPRLLPAFLATALLPGLLLLALGGERVWGALDLFEKAAFGFGLSFLVMTLLSILTLSLQGGLRQAAIALLALSIPAAVFVGWRKRPAGELRFSWSPERLVPVLLFLALALVGVLLYRIGGLAGTLPNREEALHILITRKLLESPRLSTRGIFYKPDVSTPYLFPPYHFLMAMTARFSGLDPIAVFERLRFAWGVLTLLALYAVLKQLFRSPPLASFGTLILAAMVLSGRASGWWDYFGRLTPLSHHGDVSLGLLLPVGLLFVLKLVADPTCPRAYWVASPLVLIAVTITHTREGVQLLFYLLAFLAGAFIFRDRKLLARAAFLAASLIVFGLVYQQIQSRRVEHVQEWESAELTRARALLARCGSDPIPCLIGPPSRHLQDWSPLVYGYFLLAMALTAPLLASGRTPFVLASLAILATLAVVTVPLLTLLFVVSTYSQVLFTPVHYLFHWSYLILALTFYALAVLADRLSQRLGERLPFGRVQVRAWLGDDRREDPPDYELLLSAGWLTSRGLPVLGLAGAVALLLLGARILRSLVYPGYGLYLAVLFCAAVLALVYRFRGGELMARAADAVAGHRFRSPSYALVLLSVVLLGLGLDTERPDREMGHSGASLVSQFLGARKKPDVASLSEWYRASRFLDIPYPMIRFIRGLPPGKLFAYAPETIHRLPVLVNHYVFTYGSFSSNEIDFVELYGRIQGVPIPPAGGHSPRLYQLQGIYHRQVLDRFPLYNDQDAPEVSLAFIGALGIDYVIWRKSGESGSALGRKLPVLLPGSFEPAFESGRFTLYRVKRSYELLRE